MIIFKSLNKSLNQIQSSKNPPPPNKQQTMAEQKKQKLDPYEGFQELYFPHQWTSIYGLTREHLRMYFAKLKLKQPGLYKIAYQIYLKYMRDKNQSNIAITEEREIDLICNHVRSRQQKPAEESKVKSLTQLARIALYTKEGWNNTDRLIGESGLTEFQNEEIIDMCHDFYPRPTIARQRTIIHGEIETFCTSHWDNREKTIVRLDHPKELPFHMEVDLSKMKVIGGRWFDTEFLRCLILPVKFKVEQTGQDSFKVLVNAQNYIEIDTKTIDD